MVVVVEVHVEEVLVVDEQNVVLELHHQLRKIKNEFIKIIINFWTLHTSRAFLCRSVAFGTPARSWHGLTDFLC